VEEGGLNIYSFVLNNPVDHVDPFGLKVITAPDLAPYVNDLRNRSRSFAWAYDWLDSLCDEIKVVVGRDINEGPQSDTGIDTIFIPRDEFYESNRLGIGTVNDREAMEQYKRMSPVEQRLVTIAHEFGEMTFAKRLKMGVRESHEAASGFENRVRTQIGIDMMRPVHAPR
jgi:hypothetical protein